MPICTTTALQPYPVEAYTHTHTKQPICTCMWTCV